VSRPRLRPAARVYRAMLVVYPREFRRSHGRDAVELFAELHRDTRGVRARTALWARAFWSVVRDGWQERRRQVTGRRPPRRRLAAAAARVVRDARHGVRLWSRAPVHALIAAASLALGIGTSASVLSLTRTLFVRPPAVAAPERLATIGTVRDGTIETTFDEARVRQLRPALSSFEAVAADRFGWIWLTAAGRSTEVEGSLVSFNYFDVLGLRPAAGRLFHAGDAAHVSPHSVIVISHTLWTRWLAADPDIVGRQVRVNGLDVTIVGVAPRGFRGLYAGLSRDVWMPHESGQATTGASAAYAFLRPGGSFELVGRLAPGRSLTEARSELSVMLAQPGWPEEDSTGTPPRAFVEPVRGIHPGLRDASRDVPVRAAGVAAVLLVLTCLNVAGLLLARNLGRRRELSLRLALGTTRGGLLLQLCSETLLLAVAAGGLSLLAVAWGLRLIPRWFAYGLPGLSLTLDWTLAIATVVLAVAVTLVFSAVPAWLATRGDATASLNDGGSRLTGGRLSAGQLALVAGQIGLSLMLVTGAALMTRSMSSLLAAAGTDPDAVMHYRLRPSRAGYDIVAGVRFQRELLAGLESDGRIEAAALASVGPDRGWCCAVALSRAGDPKGDEIEVDNNAVTPAFFDVLGIRIEAGRGFDRRDVPGSPPVTIVSRALARRLWPATDAVGQHVRADEQIFEVIGIAEDVHPSRPGEGPVPYAYFAYWQREAIDARLFVAFNGTAADADRLIRGVLDRTGPDVHVGQAGTLGERVALLHAPQQALMSLLTACAVAALLLTALGLYGQLSIAVRRRLREIAVRLALGATPRRALAGVVSTALRPVGLGVIIGVAGVLAQGRVLERYLFGVRAADARVLAAAAAVLVLVGLLAAMLPARRAARVDAATLLRGE